MSQSSLVVFIFVSFAFFCGKIKTKKASLNGGFANLETYELADGDFITDLLGHHQFPSHRRQEVFLETARPRCYMMAVPLYRRGAARRFLLKPRPAEIRMPNSFIERCAGLAVRFYERTSNLGGRLSRVFRLDAVSRWSERRLGKPDWLAGLELITAVSLTVYFFFLMLPEAQMPRPQDKSAANVYLFTHLSHYRPPIDENYDLEFPAWGPRVASQVLTSAFWEGAIQFCAHGPDGIQTWTAKWNGYEFGLFLVTFATYQSLWLALLFAMLIWHRRDALLIILGTFAGVAYNLTIPSGEWFFPWDMPELFLFTWMILVFDRGKYVQLLFVVWLASLIKETGLVGGLLVLFGPWSWRMRIYGFGGLFAAFLAGRQLLITAYAVHTVFLPFNNATGTGTFFSAGLAVLTANVVNLFSFHLNSAWFANCGLLFLMLALPGKSIRQVQLKFMALAFIAGQFLFGYAHEFREWYELLPLGWILAGETIVAQYQKWYPGQKEGMQPTAVPADLESYKMAAGGYRLAVTGILATALVVLICSWAGIIHPQMPVTRPSANASPPTPAPAGGTDH